MTSTRSKLFAACAAALLTSAARAADAQTCGQTVNVYTDDVGGAKLLPTKLTAVTLPDGRSESRLQLVGIAPSGWDVKEVSGDRGPAVRQLTASCTAAPAFDATKTTNLRAYEEQTAYFWSQASREYAMRRLWITPPGWPLGAIKMARDGVQPNVITQGSFNTACFPIGGADGCMRVWPHEGPKIHLKTGVVTPGLVTHEYGHYAAGFVFGHMDAFGFSLPAATGDCAKLAFQEAAATMFSFLVLHDARYAAGPDPYAKYDVTRLDRWPVSCGNPQQAYDVARPLQQAFLQALWGHDPASTIKVDWGATPGANMPTDPKLANRTMANALVYALALNRGQRVDALASSVLEWLAVNEPRRAGPIRQIFAAHGLTPRPSGELCVAPTECMSFRCDNRPGAGCVSQDGMAAPGQFCTTHQQCQNGVCKVTVGVRGTCATGAPLGTACTSHQQCQSQRCDNRPGAGCVAQDGTAAKGELCTTHQQCRSGYCNTGGRISGTCN